MTRNVLAGHHEHEDRFCDPLIMRHAPWLREEIEAAHARSEAAIVHLHRSAERLAHAAAGEAGAQLRLFYHDLANFTADYLRHSTTRQRRLPKCSRPSN